MTYHSKTIFFVQIFNEKSAFPDNQSYNNYIHAIHSRMRKDIRHLCYFDSHKSDLTSLTSHEKLIQTKSEVDCLSNMSNFLIKTSDYFNTNLLDSQVFQSVVYITHKSRCVVFNNKPKLNLYFLGPKLQELFLKWCSLTNNEKIMLTYLIYFIIDNNEFELYSPIIQGLNYWNTIQDIEGNCNVSQNQ